MLNEMVDFPKIMIMIIVLVKAQSVYWISTLLLVMQNQCHSYTKVNLFQVSNYLYLKLQSAPPTTAGKLF